MSIYEFMYYKIYDINLFLENQDNTLVALNFGIFFVLSFS